MVIATNGHHVGAAIGTRFQMGSARAGGSMLRMFHADMPLSELVAALNAFRPAMLVGYASMTSVLATEQEAGRLRIDPLIVHPSSEVLAEPEYRRIGAAFDAKVRVLYACAECTFMGYGCAHSWIHINADWVLLEPVDADHRPVPPGTLSHTVLLSNLANRVQPIIRYDLGDSVVQRPDPCPCGSPFPAIRVQGRGTDVLTFRAEHGREVTIAGMTVENIVEVVPGVERFQIVQTAPAVIRVRLRTAAGADPGRVFQAVCDDLSRLLVEHDLGFVVVERDGEPARPDPGHKHRRVVPLDRHDTDVKARDD
jgi:phenylacetate-coenzyme A ligase PaaK-like adenylate-forming protein